MEDRSKKLTRQYKRYLQSSDAEKLVDELSDLLAEGKALEEGGPHLKVLQNFSSFAEAIDKAYAEYDDRITMSSRNIEISSRELTEALRNLERLNLSINTMLDSLGHGLLFFDEGGQCSNVYSKACVEMLDTNPAGRYLPDVLNFSDEEKDSFRSWLTIIFSGNLAMDFQDLKALLPQEITNKDDAVIRLDYRPMYLAGDVLSGVLLIATDVTQERLFEKSMQEARAQVLKTQQISQNRNEFSGFLFNLENLLDTREDYQKGEDGKQSYLRALHTMKGQALYFNMDAVAHEIHELENTLQKGVVSPEDVQSLQGLIQEEKELGRALFGSAFMAGEQIKTVHFSKLQGLKDLIAQHVGDQAAQDKITSYINVELLSSPIFEKFEPFRKELDRLAEQMGKPIPECRIEGENLSILSHEYEEFFNTLIHLARNIMDHGIEAAKVRQHRGKPEQGCVEITVEKLNGDKLQIVISDDGDGIDPAVIRERLKAITGDEHGEEKDEEVINHVFDASFSTKSEASLVSGQGIGMGAVKQCVCDLGGDVAIESDHANNRGTTVRIDLPHIH